MPSPAPRSRFLYERLAADVAHQIGTGTLEVGDRLPSLREIGRRYGASLTTALQAYRHLEARRLIEARPRSGYYVLPRRAARAESPAVTRPSGTPTSVRTSEWSREILASVSDPQSVPLGAAMPDPQLLPLTALRRCMAAALRADPAAGTAYGTPLGVESLRQEIARREWSAGRAAEASDILVSCGAEEALHLALAATTRPGDVVAVESPTYFGVLQAIETLGRKAMEIPTCPEEGLELEALERALQGHPVRACVVTPNFQNPLGALMPDRRKARLVERLAAAGIPLIEDDTFGELHFEGSRPRSLRAWDTEDLVLRCGSFSKTLAPGYRVGWIVPGPRYLAKVARLKLASTISTPGPSQLAIARFLAVGGYDAHLRKLRRTLRDNVTRLGTEVTARFPAGTRISRPRGGFVLWVKLPDEADALELYRRAREAGISLSPGPIFSPTGAYRSYVRLSAGHRWSERTEAGLDRLAAFLTRG